MDCDPLQQACSLCARAPWEQAPFSSSGAPFACPELLQSLFSFPTSKPSSAQLPSTLSRCRRSQPPCSRDFGKFGAWPSSQA